MIEFAVILPLFLMLSFGVIEYGMWFYESEIVTSSVNNISQAIQNNPNITSAQLQQMVDVANDGLSRISFYDPASNAGSKNYICVKAYKSQTAAAAGCTKTNLDATDPNAGGAPYGVAVDAFIAPNALTPLGNIIHTLTPTVMGITDNTAIAVGTIMPPTACSTTATAWGVLQYNPTATPEYSCFYIPFPSTSKCNGAGQVLEYSGGVNGTYSCATVTPPPNCDKAWQNLEWNGTAGTWACPNIPYVFAGGIAHTNTAVATTFWATGSPIASDDSWTKWIDPTYPSPSQQLPRNTLCTPISFTVPANLPAGQIIAQGNLVYPMSSGNNGTWRGWTVSFEKLDTGPTPPTGSSTYKGSAYLCMDHGGNWMDGSIGVVQVDAEYQSWTITFIPN